MDDAARIEALRAGDERAFAALVEEQSPRMLRMARAYVRDAGAAEDVVQEAWLAALKGLDRFEGRSSLATWLLGIVINLARTRARRDARALPFSSVGPEQDDGWPAIGEARFRPAGDRWAGHWAIAPAPWPEEALERAETARLIESAIAALPEQQRAVITLRDVIGAPAEEVRNALGITDTNQRVLLHRARTKVRAAIEAELGTLEDTR